MLFDGLDGRIARMTGTSSDFGKELDSLADAIRLASLRHCLPGSGGSANFRRFSLHLNL